MRNKYYFCEFDFEGSTIKRNVKIEMDSSQCLNKLGGKTNKQLIENIWGLKVLNIKATTKFNYINGQF